MRHKVSVVLIGICLALASAVVMPFKADCATPLIQSLMPDLVIINGKVITVDNDFSIAEAVAVKDGRIVAVGSTRDIIRLIGKRTKILDLNGETMLPGINDAHAHLASFGLQRPPLVLDVGFPNVKSISGIASMIAEKAKEVGPGKWIQGRGWDEGYLEECKEDPGKRRPTRWDIDEASPNNPVCLTEYSGHAVWVNTKALELANITKDTPDPPGGQILRDPRTGQPTGLLLEKATGLIRNIIPPWTKEQRKNAIIGAMKEFNSLGITSVTDPSVDAELLGIYNDLYNEDKFTVRMNLLLNFTGYGKPAGVEDIEQALKYVGTRTNFGNEWLRIAGYKLFADGIPPLKTGWMYKPYIGGGVGGLVIKGETEEEKEEQLRSIIRLLHKNRFQIGIHGTGERAIDVCVDEFMKCMDDDPWDARHYMIHSDFTRIETMRSIAKCNLGLNVQSSIKWTIADFMAKIVGEERAAYQWPVKSMCDAGIRVTESSDAAVTYPNWLLGVAGSVLRESKATGRVWGPEQRVTVRQAIINYTINGAWQDHMDHIKGSIEVGKLADFCVLDEDILAVDPHDIRKVKNLMTIVGGKIVYNAKPEYLYTK